MDIPKPIQLTLISTDETMCYALIIKDSISLTIFVNFQVKSFISDEHKQISLISVRSCVTFIIKLLIFKTIPLPKISSFLLKVFAFSYFQFLIILNKIIR